MLQKSVHGRTAILTLNRPEKRNAFNGKLVEQLYHAFLEFNADPEIRAILINAKGEAFSAGADLAYLKEMRNNTVEENKQDSGALAVLFEEIDSSPKLTFSAVDGFALAGGCGLATVTDFSWATPKASFGYTEAKIGFVPAIVLVYLQRKLGMSDLKSLVLTGRIIESSEALEMGLISEIIDSDNFQAEVLNRIDQLLSKVSGESVERTKKMIRQLASLSHKDAIDYAVYENAHARSTADCKRGMDAFLNKEKITW